MQSMIFYIAKTTGTKPSEVVLMLNDEKKGFYSNENKKIYISDNANDNSKETAQTVAHETSHMVDDQRYGNENKSDTYKNNREEYADLISKDFVDKLDQEYADNGYDISKATHQNSNTQINSVTNQAKQVDELLVKNTDEYNAIDKTKGESSIVVPIATQTRWIALKGKVSFMELKKQDIKQNIRIEELTAQKLAKQVKDAVNIVQDIPKIIKDIPQTINFLLENPEELKKLPPHVVKAVTKFTESFVENSKAIKDGILTNEPKALEKQAQAESDLLANVASVFIGAGIANVSVKTGKVVVEKVDKVTKTVKNTSDKIANNVAEKTLLSNAGRINSSTGKPILNMSKLSNSQKGLMGELFGDNLVKQIIPEGKKLTSMPTIGSQGIDDLYKVNKADVDYVIIEYKFNTAKQGKTKDGLQASHSWITGSKRIEKAVGDEAEAVLDSIKTGRTETWLVNVMPDGSSNIKVLDVNGKPKNIDTSKIILLNKSYNGAKL